MSEKKYWCYAKQFDRVCDFIDNHFKESIQAEIDQIRQQPLPDYEQELAYSKAEIERLKSVNLARIEKLDEANKLNRELNVEIAKKDKIIENITAIVFRDVNKEPEPMVCSGCGWLFGKAYIEGAETHLKENGEVCGQAIPKSQYEKEKK